MLENFQNDKISYIQRKTQQLKKKQLFIKHNSKFLRLFKILMLYSKNTFISTI